MTVSSQDIKEASWDARVELSVQEEQSLLQEAQQLFIKVKSFLGPDLEEVSPTFFPIKSSTVLREDEVQPSLPVNKALANAPDADDHCHHVPRIIEE